MGWGRLQNHLISDELADGRLIPLVLEHYQKTLQLEIRVVRRAGQLPGQVAAKIWNECAQLSGSASSI
jgi:hypothetical protein